MAFKFFRRKKEDLEEFPALPPLGADSDIPKFPDLGEDKFPPLQKQRGLPELPRFEEETELPPLRELPLPPLKSEEEIRKAIKETTAKPIRIASRPQMPRPVPMLDFPKPIPAERFAPKPISFHKELPKRFPKAAEPGKMFVEVERYKIVMEALGSAKASLVEADNTLSSVESINKGEELELGNWQSALDTIQKKIIETDKKLFK